MSVNGARYFAGDGSCGDESSHLVTWENTAPNTCLVAVVVTVHCMFSSNAKGK